MRKIFICYSHKDEKYKDMFQRHLNVYDTDLLIWEDRQIEVGDDWRDRIQAELEMSHAVILMVSVDFLNSKFIRNVELLTILKRKEDEGIGVYQLIVGPCDWESNPGLSKLQARPKDGKPLIAHTTKSQREAALVAFAKEVRAKVQTINLPVSPTTTTTTTTIAPEKDAPAKSNNKPKKVKQPPSIKSTLDGLYNFFSGKGKPNYWPLHLIINKPPFQFKGGQSTTSYNNFTLSVDNDALVKFFKSLTVSGSSITSGIPEYNKLIKGKEDKVKVILTRLPENLIYKLEDKRSRELIDIHRPLDERGMCVRCKFFRFEFVSAWDDLVKGVDTDKFHRAFTYYHFGDFIKAAEIMQELEKDSRKQPFWNFITKFNLVRLKSFIRNYQWDDPKYLKVVAELGKVDLEKTGRTGTYKGVIKMGQRNALF